MRRVLIESPYGSKDNNVVKRNVAYAKAASLHALQSGDAPFLSHLLYTQVLDDRVKEERDLGIEAGLVWGAAAEASLVYTDFGISDGMQTGIVRAGKEQRDVEYRTLSSWNRCTCGNIATCHGAVVGKEDQITANCDECCAHHSDDSQWCVPRFPEVS